MKYKPDRRDHKKLKIIIMMVEKVLDQYSTLNQDTLNHLTRDYTAETLISILSFQRNVNDVLKIIEEDQRVNVNHKIVKNDTNNIRRRRL